MFFARDVRDQIELRLKDATYGIEALLTEINTQRSDNTVMPKLISYGETKDQFPAVYIDLADSEFEGEIGADYKTVEETFECHISAIVTGGKTEETINDAENYLQAILMCLAGYRFELNDFENFHVIANEAIRQDLGNEKGKTMRQVSVVFDVRRNYIF